MPASTKRHPEEARQELLDIFDARPIEFPGFKLRSRTVEPVGRPTLAQWTHAFEMAEAFETASPYWVGDLLLYADTRPDWNETVTQALSQTKMARQTLHNLKSISKRVAPPARALAQSRTHAAEVAPLPPAEQERWLKRSASQGWTDRELRDAIRRSHRTTVVEGQAPTMFSVEVTVLVDLEAPNKTLAEDKAWEEIKAELKACRKAKVIAAHAKDR